MTKYRNVCFTINNWTEEDKRMVESIEATYCVFGEECGDNGTKHLQGYVELGKQIRFEALKKLLPRAHIEARRGTAKQAADYCKKEGKYYERGTISEQGKRTDLERCVEMIKENKTDVEIYDEIPGLLRYNKAIETYKQASYKERTEKPTVHWLWGKAGVGKTRKVIDGYGANHVYIKDGTQWWNGYKQETVILIDDFDGKWPFRDLLRLLDRYKYQGQTKGGYVQINSPRIYITCEYNPQHFWDGNELDQVLRRLDFVSEVGVSEVDGNTGRPHTPIVVTLDHPMKHF